jgi:predicted FMN-binding regulatory protein PaiB
MATNTDATPIIFARVPRALVAALDRRVKRQQRQQPGARVTRSDIIRQLLDGIVYVIMSSVKSSATFPLTRNRANSAMVRSTMALDLETIMDRRLKRPNPCRWRP